MRSVLRWLRRLVTGVFLLAVIVIAAVLIAARTAWGREQLRARVEKELQAKFPGGAHVGAIEGSILGTLTVRDLELDGRDRTPQVTVGALDVSVALWPLLSQTARIDELIADDVHVFVHDQPPPAPEPRSASSPSPPPWRIELPHVEIHHATLAIGAGASTQRLTGIEASGTATILTAGASTIVGRVHGLWSRAGATAARVEPVPAELTATATVVLDGGVRVPAAQVTLGSTTRPPGGDDASSGAFATITATDLAIDVDHPSGKLMVSAPARAIATLFPELDRAGIAPERLGDVAAMIDVAAATPTTTRVQIDATADQTTLSASLEGSTAAGTVRGKVSAHAVDLALWTGGQVGGRGELSAAGTAHRAGDAISVELSRIVATAPAVDVLGRRLTGELAVDATATGKLGPSFELAVAGEVSGKNVAFDDVAISAVTGPFSLRSATGAPRAEAHLTARGVRNAGTWLGAVHADVENYPDGTLGVAATAWPPTRGLEIFAGARVTLGGQGKPTVARLDRTRVILPDGMRWDGRGGLVSMTDARVALRGVTMGHDGATVALGGDFTRATGALTAHVEADQLPASAIDARYRGLGRGTLDLARRGGRWQADGTFMVSGFAARAKDTPIDGSVHVVLAARKATLEARATSPALGGVELALEAAPPRDPFDPGAWRMLDRRAIRNATITARRAELSGVAGLVGPSAIEAPLTGTIDGAVNLASSELRGVLAVRGVELPFGTLDGDVTFAPHDGDLGANATARLSGIATGDLTARFAMPDHPFDPASWRNRGRDFLKEAAADLDDVAFDPEVLARLGVARLLAAHGLPAPYRGHAAVELALGAAASEARLGIDLNDLRGGAIDVPLSSHLAISVDAQGTKLRATFSGQDGARSPGPGLGPGPGPENGADHRLALGTIDASVPMSIDRWIAEPSAALQAPITASWTLPVTPARSVLAIVGRDDLAGGSLEGGAMIRGTLATPIVESAWLVAHDLAVMPRPGGHAPPAFAELKAAASWDGAKGTVEISGRQASDGELYVSASGRPDALAGVTGHLGAERLDLSPIAAMVPGAFVPTAGAIKHADLTLHPGGRLNGELQVTGGALPISASVGTLHDLTADVTISEHTIAGTVDGKLGRGTVHLSAETTPDLSTIDLHELTLKDVSVLGTFRPILNATIRTPEHAGLRRESGQIHGKLLVQGARITLPEQTGTPLLDAAAPPDLEFKDAPEVAAAPGPKAPAHPWLVLDIALAPTRLDAPNVVDSVGLGVKGIFSSDNLTVSLGDSVGVLGNLAIDNADVDFLGRRYRLDESKPSLLKFAGTTDPELDIHLTYSFPTLTLYADVEGSARHLEKPTFRSEPGGYSQDQLFGFFVGGEPGGDPNSQTREAVKGAVVQGISGKLGREVSKVLPIKVDALSCEPATTATSASCTVGKWLSERLFLAYRQHLEALPDENANDVQFQYRFGRRVQIEGTGGDRGHYGADLLWRARW